MQKKAAKGAPLRCRVMSTLCRKIRNKMAKWIKSKEEYIAPDFKLAKLVPNKINIEDMYEIIGKKDAYTYNDAKA
ncbi:MAG: hypothetical protein R8K21_00185 [Mariprofundales bacterium]